MPLTEDERQRIHEEERARQEIRRELDSERRKTGRGRLYKSRTDRVLLGVAGGLAEHFDVSPLLVRIGFVVLCFLNLIGVVAYVLLAILMPQAPSETGD